MNYAKMVVNFLKGKKVFIISACGLVYGFGTGDMEIVYASLLAIGFRDAMK